LAVLLSNQHLLHPAIELLPVFGLKPDIFAASYKPPIASKLNSSARTMRMFTPA